jgi:hypothetical protein
MKAIRHVNIRLTPRHVAWILVLVFTALTVRLALFLDRYVVNLLYLDQWGFLDGLFTGADPWTLFRWQHGPQRQGLGNLITAVVLTQTGWNGKADVAVCALTMLLAGLAGLWLVKRICGGVRPWDAAVPLLFLTTTNVEGYIITPNLAHGPLPALFLTCYGLSLTVGSHPLRAVLIAVINFLAVNTGFTMLLGAITPAVLVLLACQPALRMRERAAYGVAFAGSLAAVALFAHDLTWMPAVDCFQFPADQPWQYVPFAGRILARPLNPKIGLLPGEPLGTAVALATVAFTGYAILRALRSRGTSTLWNVVAALMAFTLVFAFVTALGRVCLGLGSADSMRYIPYVLPGLLALHLALRAGVPPGRARAAVLAVFLSVCFLKETSARSRREAAHESALKRAWHDCYLSIHDIAICNATAGRPILPMPEFYNLQQKLDWLEARGYNLFQDRD